jgi:hypothetical protein
MKKTEAAKLLGKAGGEAKSAAQAAASRQNGTKGGRPKNKTDLPEEIPSILGSTLEVINQLESEGLIQKPTIGGSVALMFYTEPVKTDGLDMFCYIPNQGMFIDLEPIYRRLEQLGCKTDGMHINIKGINVQFQVPANQPLVEEALEHAACVKIEGVDTHVFEYEYALAVKAETNRLKDWAHILTAIDSAAPDKEKLETILAKYDLLKKWRQKTEE